jgi:ABC-2 type transport system ATP-binding protein
MDALMRGDEVKGRVGAVLQATALQDAITVREALDFFGAFYVRRIATGRLMERFGLVEKGGARFETLSGGERQRLALALAFVNDPGLLVLDEPTSGLDPQARRELHGAIRECRAEGRAVLLTTHYIEEAEAVCDRIGILHGGRIVATGTPGELIARSGGRTRVAARTGRAVDVAAVAGLRGVTEATVADGVVTLTVGETGGAIIELVRYLDGTGNELLDLQVKRASLEDVFIELTGEGGVT